MDPPGSEIKNYITQLAHTAIQLVNFLDLIATLLSFTQPFEGIQGCPSEGPSTTFLVGDLNDFIAPGGQRSAPL